MEQTIYYEEFHKKLFFVNIVTGVKYLNEKKGKS